MKNKYQRLSKEEKKSAKIEYKNSNATNANIYKKVKRLNIICIIGMIYAVLSFGIDFYLTIEVWDYILDSVLLIFCLLFYIGSNSILSNQINKYLIDKNKQSKKGK